MWIGSDNMKIEKLNDNQIRCTLTRADLADRQIKLSELVCGTDKAKSLFQDMMRRASSEFGFEAEDMPLMIEAVPSSSDSIVLIITKVDDPEELDHKFSRFGSSIGDLDKKRNILDKLEGAEDILDLINKVKNAALATSKESIEEVTKQEEPRMRMFSFPTMDCVIHAAHLLKDSYKGDNALYKDKLGGVYVLVLTQSDYSLTDFNKFCNMLTEFGYLEKASQAVLAYLEEHCEVIVANEAIQQLGTI